MSLNASQLSAMTRFFSPGVFREIASKGRSGLFVRLFDASGIGLNCQEGVTVRDVFESAFNILKSSGLRDEYIYRTALTKKVLLGKHSLNTASMLNEFRAGYCKADLVILNGTSTVYEIKSERDSLTRLANQINNYAKVFAAVNVITSEKHVDRVLSMVPNYVGVLNLTSRYTIEVIKNAAVEPERTCPTTIFESVRADEAKKMLKFLGHKVPELPNTQMHAAMREIFSSIPSENVHDAMVKTLKKTRNLAPLSDFVNCLPPSLHAAALSIKVPVGNYQRLIEAISTPISVAAMAWV